MSTTEEELAANAAEDQLVDDTQTPPVDPPIEDDADKFSKKGRKMRYYRSQVAGLSVYLDAPKDGDVAPQTVRFMPYYERVNGDDSKVGYLVTDDARAIPKLAEDYNVEEITKKEFDAATAGENARPASV